MSSRNQEILLLKKLKEICEQKLLVKLILDIMWQKIHEVSIVLQLESLVSIITPLVVKVGLYFYLQVLI